MVAETTPVYTRRHWAKSDREDRRSIHLLEHHLADVGACFEVLLKQTTIRQRLARTAGQADLDSATAARLCVFAALHDIGKINTGFQTQIWTTADLQGRPKPHRASHTSDLVPVLLGEDYRTNEWFLDALGWDELRGWDSDDGNTVSALFAAAFSHHGEPLNLYDSKHSNSDIWRPFAELNPEHSLRYIVRQLRQWFPDAWAPGVQPLPAAPAFQHMFLGLCTLADWIGSSEQWFQFSDVLNDDYILDARSKAAQAIWDIGLDVAEQRLAFSAPPGFGDLFDLPGNPSPNAMQRKVALETPLHEPLVIIESETGSGKTEAALWRFALMYQAGLVDGLYFALPTRSAATQLHGRVDRFLTSMFPAEHKPEPVLAVPGYLRAGNFTGQHLSRYEVWWEDHPGHDWRKLWAAEDAKRFLAAQIAVGAVDQAMMGALQVRHAHMRAACLARESIPYPAVITGDASGESVSGVDGNTREKRITVSATPTMREFSDVAQRALAAARQGAKVLVIRNTVNFAIETQRALEETVTPEDGGLLFACRTIPTLHHGRFAAEDRTLLDAAVEEQVGRKRDDGGLVLVGTQTLEQSLDIDADLLITDLCPMDVLLQRIGRLHRHDRPGGRPAGFETATCVVLTPGDDDLSPFLTPGSSRNGLGPRGFVYEDLRILEATRQLVQGFSESGDPWLIPAMNRMLVERATHPQTLQVLVDAMGDDWIVHGNQADGAKIADDLTAQEAVIKRNLSFLDQGIAFGSKEERIRTRLGDEGVKVLFDPKPSGASSPFDAETLISQLSIPYHMSRGLHPEEAVAVVATDDGFEFDIESAHFRYDRWGLRRL